MKSLLNAPAGWYLFRFGPDSTTEAGQWDGKQFIPSGATDPLSPNELAGCQDFRRLVPAAAIDDGGRSGERHGWHLTHEGTAGRSPSWSVRYFQDGKTYLCDPVSYERRCNDERVPFNGDLILLGPDYGSPAVKISPQLAQAAEEVARLQTAIRKHRDARGDDRCWLDDEELYRLLPEGFTPPARDSAVELARCQQFIACRHNPATEYISPQRRIEELEALLRRAIPFLESCQDEGPTTSEGWQSGDLKSLIKAAEIAANG